LDIRLRSRLEVAGVVVFVVRNGSALRIEVAALDTFSKSQGQPFGIRGWERVQGAIDGVGFSCCVDVEGVVALGTGLRLAGGVRRVALGRRGGGYRGR
jgi:hypothetical protein